MRHLHLLQRALARLVTVTRDCADSRLDFVSTSEPEAPCFCALGLVHSAVDVPAPGNTTPLAEE